MDSAPFASMDIHRNFSRAAVMNRDADVLAEKRISHEVRRMRWLFRTRILFVHMRTKAKNSVHGILHRLGVDLDEEASDLFGVRGLAILKLLDTEGPPRRELARKLAVIDDLDCHVAMLERDIKADLASDGRAELVMTIPGVGGLTAPPWKRFRC